MTTAGLSRRSQQTGDVALRGRERAHDGSATMLSRAEAYLAYRRSLASSSKIPGKANHILCPVCRRHGVPRCPLVDIALRWAKAGATVAIPSVGKRLEVLRPFATFLADRGRGTTTFPAYQSLWSHETAACSAYLHAQEITAIIAESHHIRRVQAAGTLMMPALIGLLASTGLRISEALALQVRDLDLEAAQILVREAKYGRQRWSPSIRQTVAALETFLDRRNAIFPSSPADPVFLSELVQQKLSYMNALHAWFRITPEAGIRPRGGTRSCASMIFDTASYAAAHPVAAKRNGDRCAMLMLSTYVGHANLLDTYWYIESVPELMAIAAIASKVMAIFGGDFDD